MHHPDHHPDEDPAEVEPTDNSSGALVDLDRVRDIEQVEEDDAGQTEWS